jgi:hypothetical protein
MDDDAQPRRLWWLILLLTVPLLVAAGVGAWMVLSPTEAEPTNQGPRVPELSGRGRPLNTPQPVNDNTEPTPDNTEPEPKPDQPEESQPVENSEEDIDTRIGRIRHAVKEGRGRDLTIAHAGLAVCKPDERVNDRLMFALENESSAWVRIEFFKAFHGDEARRRWGLRAYDARSAQFLGTNNVLASGEVEEIKLYLRSLLPLLFDGLSRDERLMALLRNLIDTEQPQWLLLPVLTQMLELQREKHPAGKFSTDRDSTLGTLSEQLRRMLERRTALPEVRDVALWLWLESLPDWSVAITELEQTVLHIYLPTLLHGFPKRGEGGAYPELSQDAHPWVGANAEKIADLCAQMLARQIDAEVKRTLIKAVSERAVPKGREMLDAGLARKGEFYPDWLTALGRMATSSEDLQRLTAAADDPKAEISQGAIEGLRVSTMLGADGELKRILEQGANLGAKSQALGALLDRSISREQMLDEYLDPARDTALRAVAVAFVPIKNTDRLKKIVEDDPAPRVRQSALTRLGELKDVTLLSWMISIRTNDSSPVLRAQARRYAKELEDLKEPARR